jgi:hypothetical protein
MEVRGCEERSGKWRYCYWHGGTDGEWTERGCGEAVRMADAAFAASLEWAAEQVEGPSEVPLHASTCVYLAAVLRHWARGDR